VLLPVVLPARLVWLLLLLNRLPRLLDVRLRLPVPLRLPVLLRLPVVLRLRLPVLLKLPVLLAPLHLLPLPLPVLNHLYK
jgi:hypothetical protein